MAAGTIIRVWHDDINVYASVAVNEGGLSGIVQYVGSMALADFQALPDAATKKAALQAAVKAVRDAQLNAPADVAITGAVTL